MKNAYDPIETKRYMIDILIGYFITIIITWLIYFIHISFNKTELELYTYIMMISIIFLLFLSFFKQERIALVTLIVLLPVIMGSYGGEYIKYVIDSFK